MEKKFYADTSIWVDLFDDRKGYHDEPLGNFALKIFSMIQEKRYKLIVTNYLIRELEVVYSIEEIDTIMKLFENILEKIYVMPEQREEAKKIALERNIPAGDVLHAIIARDNNLILLTRDKHFMKLEDIAKHYKPEEII